MTDVKYFANIDGERRQIQSLEQGLPKIVQDLKNKSCGNTGFFKLDKEEGTNTTSIIIVYPYVSTVREENVRRAQQGLPKLNFRPQFDESRFFYLSSGIPTLFNIEKCICVDVDEKGIIHLVYPLLSLNSTLKKKPKDKANPMAPVLEASPALRFFLGQETKVKKH